MDGVINVYKEKGYTSHDVVAIIKKTLKIKAGHTGTLDPNAVGVLPICLGKCTKLADYVTDGIKGYRGVLKLGIETDTEDITGNILCENKVSLSQEDILSAIKSFVGKYAQIPPMYSAIKVNGEKLYNLARKGIEIERKSRDIEIYSIDNIVFIDSTSVQMDIICSKGTYIRSLCRDIGKKLKVGGCMGDLIRIKSGDFLVEDSITLSKIKEYAEDNKINEYIIPTDMILKNLSSIKVKADAYKYLYNGNKINEKYIITNEPLAKNKRYRVYNFEDEFIGVYELCEDNFIKPMIILKDFNK